MAEPRPVTDLDELPPDDYLVAARRADRELARKIELECRRPVHDWNHDVTGPTEAYRRWLADTDPGLQAGTPLRGVA